MPAVSAAPRIDGKLDDPCWREGTHFVGQVECVGFPPPVGAGEIRCGRGAGSIHLVLAAMAWAVPLTKADARVFALRM